ncbi:MAG: hypothetical protein RKP73_08730 [Candidatus Contendobacter sp.]|nr:hypothetical protein [Candidatus Contendobacter sp.]
MASSETIAVDPRIITNLVCLEGGLHKFPSETLHRLSVTLDFLSDLLENYDGGGNFLESKNSRFALSLQLSSISQVLGALMDAIQIREPKIRSGEIIISLSTEELEKLALLAVRARSSICEIVQNIVADSIREFAPDKRRATN